MDVESLRKNGTIVIVGLVISLFSMLAYGLGWFTPIYASGNFILRPMAYWGRELIKGVENTAQTVGQISLLSKENAKMKNQVAQLTAELGVLREVKDENDQLRSQLGIPLTKDWQLVKAIVLGSDTYGIAEYVIIDSGSSDGVSVGDPVIIGDILVGEVREVQDSISKVRLVSNTESNIYAIDQNTNAKGLVRGSLQGIVMEEILESEAVEVGDIVVTWEDEMPGKLVIGSVSRIENVPTSSTKKAYIDPGFNIEDITHVFVVTGGLS